MCDCVLIIMHISRCSILRDLAIRRNSSLLWNCLSSLPWLGGKWLVVWRSLSFVSERQKGRRGKFDLRTRVLLLCFQALDKNLFGFLMLFCKEGEMAFGPFDPSSTSFHLEAEAADCLLGCSAVLPVLNFRQVTWHRDASCLYPWEFYILTMKWRILISLWKSKKSVMLRL